MRLERIADLDFRVVALAPECVLHVVVIDERNDEIVDANESPVYLLTRGRSDGYCRCKFRVRRSPPSYAAGHQPPLLECAGVRKSRGDVFQIGGSVVAASALRPEVRFARLGVPDDNCRWPLPRPVISGDAKAVNKCGDVGELRIREFQFGHRTGAAPDHVADQFTLLVVENDLRAQEVGTAIAPTGVVTVAETARHVIEPSTSRDNCRICGRPLRIGVGESTSSSTAAAA